MSAPTKWLNLFHYHAFYGIVFIVCALVLVILRVDLWAINGFRLLLLSLGMYEMLGHVSFAITKHSVRTTSIIIDHGNRIIDGLLHGFYAMLFLHSSLHDKYSYHWVSIIHAWFCILHIFKYSPYGDNEFRIKLRRQQFMNLFDALLHLASFMKLIVENGIFDNSANNSVYMCVFCIYLTMRQRNLIW